jgi:hypothetical protein
VLAVAHDDVLHDGFSRSPARGWRWRVYTGVCGALSVRYQRAEARAGGHATERAGDQNFGPMNSSRIAMLWRWAMERSYRRFGRHSTPISAQARTKMPRMSAERFVKK